MDLFGEYFTQFAAYFLRVCSVSFTVFGIQVYYGSFLIFAGLFTILYKFLRGLSE